ncbi:hypothetical protein Gasu2_64830 [Galdieria sulphuraria]|uniref:Uncharacterized protein n=1 Tax=Galdieria sulphuraria TaxID=130081 RepID=M2Y587_GALSU|nr:uncharacterized protein Gasu_16300 [Galdieria sulphuraria]EME31133.1 hypothetical protein Gasu_16300 [Galdieria sulphuraria]GJD12396.1 hypothetical protein Gasu2_64830 [Galdieria sulphuraria]|eukprot:XP_005707653.1 hypothetical protein Gasu_16300 [Galdieria sulphuraria]
MLEKPNFAMFFRAKSARSILLLSIIAKTLSFKGSLYTRVGSNLYAHNKHELSSKTVANRVGILALVRLGSVLGKKGEDDSPFM